MCHKSPLSAEDSLAQLNEEQAQRLDWLMSQIDVLADAGQLSRVEAERLQEATEHRRDKCLADQGVKPVTSH